MSERWFHVPVTIMLEIGVTKTDDVDADRSVAADLAKNFVNKPLTRIECDYAAIQTWPYGPEIGYPECQQDIDESDDE